MVWVPTFKIYDYTGVTPLYTFTNIQYTNAPQSVEGSVEISNLRGQGSLIINGGQKAWDLELKFILIGTDYIDLTTKIDTLEGAILLNTPYQILIAKSPSTAYQYKIKRIESFIYEDSLRVKIQRINARFRVNCWA